SIVTYVLFFYSSFFFLSTSFFSNDPAPTEIYTLSLHDALPISLRPQQLAVFPAYFQFTHSRTTSNPFNQSKIPGAGGLDGDASRDRKSTSELQSLAYLVCRLLLEKKKKMITLLTFEKLKTSSSF